MMLLMIGFEENVKKQTIFDTQSPLVPVLGFRSGILLPKVPKCHFFGENRENGNIQIFNFLHKSVGKFCHFMPYMIYLKVTNY